jgi:hypothetical protein
MTQAPHLEIAIAPGLVEGFLNCGIPAKVLWEGSPQQANGIEYLSIPQSELDVRPDDIVLVSNPNSIKVFDRVPALQKATRRWLFTSCDHSDKSFASFEVILCENDRPRLEAKYPQARIFDFLMGCPAEIPLTDPTPYVNPRTVFFCGRLTGHPPAHNERLDHLRQLALMLPDHHFILLASSITLPVELTPPEWQGHVIVPYTRPNTGTLVQTTPSLSFLHVHSAEVVAKVNKAIGTNNLAFWGARNWGTFWGLYRHALCCLDFGFAATPQAPNTKVIDVLRSGTRLIAAGCSSTFDLVREHGGVVLPYRDIDGMAQAIKDTPLEPLAIKDARGLDFAQQHGWTPKMRRLIENLEPDYFQGG